MTTVKLSRSFDINSCRFVGRCPIGACRQELMITLDSHRNRCGLVSGAARYESACQIPMSMMKSDEQCKG
jgi:hypothetical protein